MMIEMMRLALTDPLDGFQHLTHDQPVKSVGRHHADGKGECGSQCKPPTRALSSDKTKRPAWLIVSNEIAKPAPTPLISQGFDTRNRLLKMDARRPMCRCISPGRAFSALYKLARPSASNTPMVKYAPRHSSQ